MHLLCVHTPRTLKEREREREREKKGKSVPLQTQGAQRVPDYVTMAQNVGKLVSLMHWPFLPPGNTPGTHFC